MIADLEVVLHKTRLGLYTVLGLYEIIRYILFTAPCLTAKSAFCHALYVLTAHWKQSHGDICFVRHCPSPLILPPLYKHPCATIVIQSITIITHSRRNITTVIQKCTAVQMYERCDPDKIFKRHYSEGPPRPVWASFHSSGVPRATMPSCSMLQNMGLSHPVLGWAAYNMRYDCRPPFSGSAPVTLMCWWMPCTTKLINGLHPLSSSCSGVPRV